MYKRKLLIFNRSWNRIFESGTYSLNSNENVNCYAVEKEKNKVLHTFNNLKYMNAKGNMNV